MTGGALSVTMTLIEAVAELPWPSFAVQVTVVSPIGNVEPDLGVQLKLRTPATALDADAL